MPLTAEGDDVLQRLFAIGLATALSSSCGSRRSVTGLRDPDFSFHDHVVLTDEQTGSFIKTTARHFLPGIGLAREVIITATNEHVMQNRMEWVLKDVR